VGFGLPSLNRAQPGLAGQGLAGLGEAGQGLMEKEGHEQD